MYPLSLLHADPSALQYLSPLYALYHCQSCPCLMSLPPSLARTLCLSYAFSLLFSAGTHSSCPLVSALRASSPPSRSPFLARSLPCITFSSLAYGGHRFSCSQYLNLTIYKSELEVGEILEHHGTAQLPDRVSVRRIVRLSESHCDSLRHELVPHI